MRQFKVQGIGNEFPVKGSSFHEESVFLAAIKEFIDTQRLTVLSKEVRGI